MTVLLGERSQRNSLVKNVTGLYLYATGAQRQAISILSSLGLSASYPAIAGKGKPGRVASGVQDGAQPGAEKDEREGESWDDDEDSELDGLPTTSPSSSDDDDEKDDDADTSGQDKDADEAVEGDCAPVSKLCRECRRCPLTPVQGRDRRRDRGQQERVSHSHSSAQLRSRVLDPRRRVTATTLRLLPYLSSRMRRRPHLWARIR